MATIKRMHWPKQLIDGLPTLNIKVCGPVSVAFRWSVSLHVPFRCPVSAPELTVVSQGLRRKGRQSSSDLIPAAAQQQQGNGVTRADGEEAEAEIASPSWYAARPKS